MESLSFVSVLRRVVKYVPPTLSSMMDGNCKTHAPSAIKDLENEPKETSLSWYVRQRVLERSTRSMAPLTHLFLLFAACLVRDYESSAYNLASEVVNIADRSL